MTHSEQTVFSDAALRAAVKTPFASQQQRLRQLAEDGENRSLTEAEAEELTQLIDSYDRAILWRAKAMVLLIQRGFDVPPPN